MSPVRQSTCDAHHGDYAWPTQYVIDDVRKYKFRPHELDAFVAATRRAVNSRILSDPELRRSCAVAHVSIFAIEAWLIWMFTGQWAREWTMPLLEIMEQSVIPANEAALVRAVVSGNLDDAGRRASHGGEEITIGRNAAFVFMAGYVRGTTPYGCALTSPKQPASLVAKPDDLMVIARAITVATEHHPADFRDQALAVLDDAAVPSDAAIAVLYATAARIIGADSVGLRKAVTSCSHASDTIAVLLVAISTACHTYHHGPTMARKVGAAYGWVKGGAEPDRFQRVNEPAIAYTSAIVDEDDEGAAAVLHNGAGLLDVGSGLIEELEKHYGQGDLVWLG